jgi:signal transduction histidine kinase
VFNRKIYKNVKVTLTVITIWSVAVLLGWQFNVTFLKSIFPGLIAMNPFTALAYIAASGWLYLKLRRLTVKAHDLPVLAILLSLIVLFIGGLKIFDLITSKNYYFDNIFFTDLIGASEISPFSAFNFLLLGIFMLLTELKQFHEKAVLWFIAPVFIISSISLFGYIIGSNNVHTLKPFKPMALQSSISALALVTCFLFVYHNNVLIKTVRKKDSGGYIARRLLPYIIVVPVLIAYLRYQGQFLGHYETGFGVALFMVASIIIFLIVVVRQSRELSAIDQQRREAQKVLEQRSRELVAANAELEKRNKELEQFAYAASHDMQEPLRKIHTFSSILKQHSSDKLDDKGKLYVSKIEASVARMKLIIEDLLNYSHSTSESTSKQKVDLNNVIETVKNDLELVIEERSARIIKDDLPVIFAVPAQMQQLFYNLLSNALKFVDTSVSPEVKVRFQKVDESDPELPFGIKKESYAKITVSDNGIGFEQEYADKIFSLFKRLHGRSEYGGTGIGLALCKKVAENHGGAIYADSTPGKGSVFTVLLPLHILV